MAVFTNSIFKYLPEKVGAVDFDLHCKRGGRVNDIRKGKICSAQIVRDAMHAPSQATTSLNFFPLANVLGVLKPEFGLKTVYPYAVRHFNH